MVLVTVNPAFQRHELHYVSDAIQVHGALRRSVAPRESDVGHSDRDPARVPQTCEMSSALATGPTSLQGGDAFDGAVAHRYAPDDPVMLQYTSGTTGFPKGALLHHRGLINNGHHCVDRLGVDDGDVYVATMPLFHTGGSALSVLGCVSKKLTQVLVPLFDPGLVIELSQTYRSNAMLGVPTMLVAILEHPDFPDADLTSLKALCSGGSLVPEQLVRTFEDKLGAPFTIVFRPDRVFSGRLDDPTADTIEDKASTIGPPMPNVEVRIVGPESARLCPSARSAST